MTARSKLGDGPVMVLSHTHPSISKGGAEIASYSLYEGLRALGVQALFVAACPEADLPRLRLGSAAERIVVTEPALYDDFYHIAAPSVVAQLQALVEAERPGVINLHHFLGFGLNGLRALGGRGGGADAARIVLTLHEFLAICQNHGQMVKRVTRHLCDAASPNDCAACFPDRTPERFVLRRRFALDALAGCSGFVAPSRFLTERFVAWGLAADRVAVIENGLRQQPGAAAPAPGPRTRGADADRRWVFGFFGQINPFKGVDIILQAAELIARVPALADRVLIRIHGNIVGQEAGFAERFRAAVAAHAWLEYVGPYENNNVGRLMQLCDYVLVPSTWWENSPVVIQEAFQADRPVVCTGIGGMAEKVPDDVAGLHFRVGDPHDLMRVLARAADPDVHGRLRAGLPRVSGTRRMAEDYLAAFERFVSMPPPSSPMVAGASVQGQVRP